MNRILSRVAVGVAATLAVALCACLAIPALALLVAVLPALFAFGVVLRLACDMGIVR